MSSTPPAGDDRGRTTDPWGNPLPQPAPVPPPAWGPPPGQPPAGAGPDGWRPPGGQGAPAGGPPAPEGWGPPGAVPPTYGQPPVAPGQPPVAPGQHPGYPPQPGYGPPPPAAHPGYDMPGQGPAPSGWGWYQGPPQQDRQATTALVLAIASVLCAGLLGAVMGVIAIVLGVAARKRIAASNGRLTGGGLAVAAIAVATGGIILSIAFIVYLLANPNFLDQLTRPR